MTESEYLAAAKRACEIPSGPNWNDRFLAALAAYKLKLGFRRQYQYQLMAPWPTSDEPFRWPRMSYIVEDDGEE